MPGCPRQGAQEGTEEVKGQKQGDKQLKGEMKKQSEAKAHEPTVEVDESDIGTRTKMRTYNRQRFTIGVSRAY